MSFTFFLLELRPHLVIYLSHHDLTQLSLINKQCNLAWGPFLWTEIRLMNNTHALAFLNPECVHSALVRNRHLVRVFRNRSDRGDVVRLFSDALLLSCNEDSLQAPVPPPQLTAPLGALSTTIRLTELYLTSRGRFDKKTNKAILAILESTNQTLQRLHIENYTLSNHYLLSLLRTICCALGSLRHLCLFKRLAVDIPPLAMKVFLETLPSSLESLTLGWFHFSHQSKVKDDQTMRLAPLYEQKPHPRLKWFSLGAGYDPEYTRLDSEIAAAIFVPFLKGCSPALKVDGVNLSYSWEFFHPAVNDALATLTGTRPRYFEIPSGEYDQQQDEALASTLLNLWVRQRQDLNPPQEVWTSIQVKGCPTSSPRAFRAIIEACQHGLENLLIYLGQRITSQEIQTILHTSTSLRRLSFFHIPRPLFDYRAMLQSSWNCTRTLTQLDIHITNIPRPDVLFDWRGDKIPPERKTPNHTGAIQESRAFQRDVYTRLASLVNLETLELGTSCPQLSMVEIFFPDGQKGSFDRNQQLCCLEMTLDSGLEILSTLKNLRILLVESMEHRIGIRELKWFERAWPNLLYLGGIVSQTKRTSILYGLDIPDLETCDLGYGLH